MATPADPGPVRAATRAGAALHQLPLTVSALAELGAVLAPARALAAAAPRRHPAVPGPAAALRALRGPANLAFFVALTVIVTGWWVWLRPTTFLGGPATYIVVHGTSMLPTLRTGDMVLAEAQPGYHVGELVVYRVPRGNLGAGDDLIHRIVGGTARAGYTLQGDNNRSPDPWTVPEKDIVGRATLVLPGAGTWFLTIRSPIFAGGVAGVIAMTLVLFPGGRGRRAGGRSRAAEPSAPVLASRRSPPRTPSRTG